LTSAASTKPNASRRAVTWAIAAVTGQPGPLEAAHRPRREGDPEHETGIANAVAEENKQGVAGRDRSFPGVSDEQPGAETGKFPADEGQHRVAGQNDQQHAGKEQAHAEEEARETGSRCR
jgi:hypothetical protein